MSADGDKMFEIGSLPVTFDYGPDDIAASRGVPSENKPRILLMGPRRSGKSSIQKVVFHKMSPNETLFLESTNKIVRDDISSNSFIQFQIWDCPGQIDFFDSAFEMDEVFAHCGSLIWVIDAQDEYVDAVNKLTQTVARAHKINDRIRFEVFIHKVDGLSDEHKIEVQRDIAERVQQDEHIPEDVCLSYHLTSIYDHSIFEAFSKVVQKLTPQLPALENLLNLLNATSGIEKSFLFDVFSKIYVATDCGPVEMELYELCCDMIDVVFDIGSLYGGEEACLDAQSSAVVRLRNGMLLYLREVNKHLAFICLVRQEQSVKQGIIDYNFHVLKKAIQNLFEIKHERKSIGDSGEM